MKDLQLLTGKKMSLFERIAFKSSQRKLRDHILLDGSFDKAITRKWERFYAARNESGKGFQAGGFFLGFLLSWIGIIIAYLINDDQKRNRVKWAWIGFAAGLVLVLLLIAMGVALYRFD